MSNPIPENVRRGVWNLLRPYKDVKVISILGKGVTVNWVLNRMLGYDRGNI